MEMGMMVSTEQRTWFRLVIMTSYKLLVEVYTVMETLFHSSNRLQIRTHQHRLLIFRSLPCSEWFVLSPIVL